MGNHQHLATPRPRGRAWQRFRKLVIEMYGTTCYLCGKPIDLDLPVNHGMDITIDHDPPLARGGTAMDIETARPAHRSCNSSRGEKLLAQVKAPLKTSRRW